MSQKDSAPGCQYVRKYFLLYPGNKTDRSLETVQLEWNVQQVRLAVYRLQLSRFLLTVLPEDGSRYSYCSFVFLF